MTADDLRAELVRELRRRMTTGHVTGIAAQRFRRRVAELARVTGKPRTDVMVELLRAVEADRAR